MPEYVPPAPPATVRRSGRIAANVAAGAAAAANRAAGAAAAAPEAMASAAEAAAAVPEAVASAAEAVAAAPGGESDASGDKDMEAAPEAVAKDSPPDTQKEFRREFREIISNLRYALSRLPPSDNISDRNRSKAVIPHALITRCLDALTIFKGVFSTDDQRKLRDRARVLIRDAILMGILAKARPLTVADAENMCDINIRIKKGGRARRLEQSKQSESDDDVPMQSGDNDDGNEEPAAGDNGSGGDSVRSKRRADGEPPDNAEPVPNADEEKKAKEKFHITELRNKVFFVSGHSYSSLESDPELWNPLIIRSRKRKRAVAVSPFRGHGVDDTISLVVPRSDGSNKHNFISYTLGKTIMVGDDVTHLCGLAGIRPISIPTETAQPSTLGRATEKSDNIREIIEHVFGRYAMIVPPPATRHGLLTENTELSREETGLCVWYKALSCISELCDQVVSFYERTETKRGDAFSIAMKAAYDYGSIGINALKGEQKINTIQSRVVNFLPVLVCKFDLGSIVPDDLGVLSEEVREACRIGPLSGAINKPFVACMRTGCAIETFRGMVDGKVDVWSQVPGAIKQIAFVDNADEMANALQERYQNISGALLLLVGRIREFLSQDNVAAATDNVASALAIAKKEASSRHRELSLQVCRDTLTQLKKLSKKSCAAFEQYARATSYVFAIAKFIENRDPSTILEPNFDDISINISSAERASKEDFENEDAFAVQFDTGQFEVKEIEPYIASVHGRMLVVAPRIASLDSSFRDLLFHVNHSRRYRVWSYLEDFSTKLIAYVESMKDDESLEQLGQLYGEFKAAEEGHPELGDTEDECIQTASAFIRDAPLGKVPGANEKGARLCEMQLRHPHSGSFVLPSLIVTHVERFDVNDTISAKCIESWNRWYKILAEAKKMGAVAARSDDTPTRLRYMIAIIAKLRILSVSTLAKMHRVLRFVTPHKYADGERDSGYANQVYDYERRLYTSFVSLARQVLHSTMIKADSLQVDTLVSIDVGIDKLVRELHPGLYARLIAGSAIELKEQPFDSKTYDVRICGPFTFLRRGDYISKSARGLHAQIIWNQMGVELTNAVLSSASTSRSKPVGSILLEHGMGSLDSVVGGPRTVDGDDVIYPFHAAAEVAVYDGDYKYPDVDLDREVEFHLHSFMATLGMLAEDALDVSRACARAAITMNYANATIRASRRIQVQLAALGDHTIGSALEIQAEANKSIRDGIVLTARSLRGGKLREAIESCNIKCAASMTDDALQQYAHDIYALSVVHVEKMTRKIVRKFSGLLETHDKKMSDEYRQPATKDLVHTAVECLRDITLDLYNIFRGCYSSAKGSLGDENLAYLVAAVRWIVFSGRLRAVVIDTSMTEKLNEAIEALSLMIPWSKDIHGDHVLPDLSGCIVVESAAEVEFGDDYRFPQIPCDRLSQILDNPNEDVSLKSTASHRLAISRVLNAWLAIERNFGEYECLFGKAVGNYLGISRDRILRTIEFIDNVQDGDVVEDDAPAVGVRVAPRRVAPPNPPLGREPRRSARLRR